MRARGSAAVRITGTDTGRVEGASVVRAAGGEYVLRADGGAEFTAKRAAGCLLEPAAGDYVLCAGAGRGRYVLEVLERRGGPARLDLPGDAELVAGAGRLTVAARDGVSIASAVEVTLDARRVRLRGEEVSVVGERLSALGEWLSAEAGRVRVVAEACESVVERVTQRLGRAYRFVRDGEYVRAREMEHRADETVAISAQNAVVTARELVKVDGDQIHLG